MTTDAAGDPSSLVFSLSSGALSADAVVAEVQPATRCRSRFLPADELHDNFCVSPLSSSHVILNHLRLNAGFGQRKPSCHACGFVPTATCGSRDASSCSAITRLASTQARCSSGELCMSNNRARLCRLVADSDSVLNSKTSCGCAKIGSRDSRISSELPPSRHDSADRRSNSICRSRNSCWDRISGSPCFCDRATVPPPGGAERNTSHRRTPTGCRLSRHSTAVCLSTIGA